jgi:hypothetical protein
MEITSPGYRYAQEITNFTMFYFFMNISEEGERQSNSQSAIHKTKKRDTYVENTVQMLWAPHR